MYKIRNGNIIATFPIENQLVMKSLKKSKMVRTIIMKIKTVKDSASKPNGKPVSGGKYLGLELDINLYEI